ncbi:hypothetical protein AB0K61_13970, partial [Streptomyces syringium]
MAGYGGRLLGSPRVVTAAPSPTGGAGPGPDDVRYLPVGGVRWRVPGEPGLADPSARPAAGTAGGGDGRAAGRPPARRARSGPLPGAGAAPALLGADPALLGKRVKGLSTHRAGGNRSYL